MTPRGIVCIDGRGKRFQLAVQTASDMMADGELDGIIFDGGANRPELDEELKDLADIVLVPSTYDEESMEDAKQYLDEFGEKAYVIPSNWTFFHSLTSSRIKEFEDYFGKDRVLPKIASNTHIPKVRSTSIHKFPRSVYETPMDMVKAVAKLIKDSCTTDPKSTIIRPSLTAWIFADVIFPDGCRRAAEEQSTDGFACDDRLVSP